MVNRLFKTLVLGIFAIQSLVWPLVVSGQFFEEPSYYDEEASYGEGNLGEEVLEMRTQFAKVYQNGENDFSAEVSVAPKHYFDGESWRDINLDWIEEGENFFVNNEHELSSEVIVEDGQLNVNLRDQERRNEVQMRQVQSGFQNREGEWTHEISEYDRLNQEAGNQLVRRDYDGLVTEFISLTPGGITREHQFTERSLEMGERFAEVIEMVGDIELFANGEPVREGTEVSGPLEVFVNGEKFLTIPAPTVLNGGEPVSGTLRVLGNYGGSVLIEKSIPLTGENLVFPISSISGPFYPSFNVENGYTTTVNNSKVTNTNIITGAAFAPINKYRGWMHWNLSFIPTNLQSVSDPKLTAWVEKTQIGGGASGVPVRINSMEKNPASQNVSPNEVYNDAADGTLYNTINVGAGASKVSATLNGAGAVIKNMRTKSQPETSFAVGTQADIDHTYVYFESVAKNLSSSHIPELYLSWSTNVGGNQPPATPTLTAPTNGGSITTTTPNLSASISDGDGDPMHAYFYINTKADPFNYGATCVQNNQSNGSVSCQVSLAPGTKYYWGVGVTDGNSGEVKSQVNSFTTTNSATPGPGPNPGGNGAPYANVVSPLDGATLTGSQVELKALLNDANGDLMSGGFYISDNGGDPFSTAAKCSFSGERNGEVTCQQSIVVGKSYRWGVKVKDANNGYQNSKVWGFNVSQVNVSNPPSAPQNLSPASGTSLNQPYTDLKWTTFDQDGDHMRSFVYLSTFSDPFNNPVGIYPVITSSEAGGQKSHFASNLKPGKYYWGVIAQDVNGNSSAQSAVNSFTIKDRTTSPNSRRQGVNVPGTQEIVIVDLSQSGDPVTLQSGEFTYDLPIVNAKGNNLDLNFNLHYRSQTNFKGPFGYNWDHNFNKQLVDDGLQVALFDGMGSRIQFTKESDGSYSPADGYFDTLKKTSFGFELRKPNGDVLEFDNDGVYEKFSDRHGNALTMQYDANGRLVSITETRGQKLVFGYDQYDRISQVTDWTQRIFSFAYDLNGDLVKVTTPATAQFPQGLAQQFGYSKNQTDEKLNHNITTVTDMKGQVFIQNTYDGTDRVTQQVHGNGVIKYVYTLSSADGEVDATTVTDANGNVTKLEFSRAGKILKKETFTRGLQSGAPSSYITTYKYNDAGLMTQERKQRGNGTVYIYDSNNPIPRLRGNLLEVRKMENVDVAANDANDLVTKFVYEPVYGQLVKVTDARGNTLESVMDYQEGNAVSSLANIAEVDAATLQAELTKSGIGLGKGDLNGDSATNGLNGDAVRTVSPTATNGDGSTTQLLVSRVFDGAGKLLRKKDSMGRETQYVYNSSSKYLDQIIEDPAGVKRTTILTNDGRGNIVKSVDAMGKTTTFTVDNLNLVNSMIVDKPYAYEVKMEYDQNLNLKKRQVKNIDENGNWVSSNPWITTAYEYDILDRPTKTIQEMGSGAQPLVSEFQYDAVGNLVKTINGGRLVGQVKYDERNMPIEMTVAPGKTGAATVKMFYDLDGNIQKTVDAEGNVTDLHYDLYNRQIGSVDALGNVERYELDKNGNIVRVENVDGQSGKNNSRQLRPGNGVLLNDVKFKYNQLNKVIQTDEKFFTQVNNKAVVDGSLTPNDGYVTTQFTYNANGELVKVVDDQKNADTIGYDKLGQMVKKTDAIGNVADFTYDTAGRLVSKKTTEKKSAGGNDVFTDTFTYDEMGRLLTTTNSLNEKTTWKYDSRNNQKVVIDAEGNVKKYVYDPASRLTTEIVEYRQGGVGSGALTHSATTNFYYGPTSKLEAVEDPNGLVTNYVYDDLDRVAKMVDAMGEETFFTYDKNGNTVKVQQPTGTVINNTFDDLNRLVGRSVNLGTNVKGSISETFEYDGMSRMTKGDNSLAKMSFGYDSMNNLIQELGGFRDMNTSYDGLGNLTQVIYPGNNAIDLKYDVLDRLANVKANTTNLLTQSYDGYGRINFRSMKGGVAQTYGYDGAKRLASTGVYVGQTLSQGFSYGYNKVGMVTSEELAHKNGAGNRYEYDSAYQMTKAYEMATQPANSGNGAQKVWDWSYDVNGNRTMEKEGNNATAYQINELNAYKTVGNDSLLTDKNGNLQQDGDYKYYYDYRNQLVEVVENTGRKVATYEYDALGRRIKRTLHGDTAATTKVYNYVYDGDRVMYEEMYEGGVRKEYKYHYYGEGVDDIYMSNINGSEYTFAKNNVGSVVGVYNSSGALVERYEYSPFGEVKAFDAQGAAIVPGSVSGNVKLFNGRDYDAETGLYYYRARYYSPKLGRFIQRDPMGFADGMNPYAYVGNSPASFVDPLGLAKTLVAGLDFGGFSSCLQFSRYGGLNCAMDYTSEGQAIQQTVKDGNDQVLQFGDAIGGALDAAGDAIDAVDWAKALSGAGDMLQGGGLIGVSAIAVSAACAAGGGTVVLSDGTLAYIGAEMCAAGAGVGATGAAIGSAQFSQGWQELSDAFDGGGGSGGGSSSSYVDEFLDGLDDFERLSDGKLQKYVQGNIDDVYDLMRKSAIDQNAAGAYKLSDGSWIMKYSSSNTGLGTIMIDKSTVGGAIYKIRFY